MSKVINIAYLGDQKSLRFCLDYRRFLAKNTSKPAILPGKFLL